MKIIKLYLRYFFTLTNVIIFSLLIVFLSFCFFMSIYDINSSLSYEDVLKSYFENSLYYTKIITIFTVIFIFIKSFGERNAYVINFVVAAGYKKKDNYHALMIANIIISILFISILFFNFIIIGFIMKHYFYIRLEYILSYINMIILSIYYGFLAYFFITLFKSQFVFLIPFLLNMVSELLIYNNDILSRIYLFLFPTLTSSSGKLSGSSIFILLLIIVIYNINKYLYLKKDLIN